MVEFYLVCIVLPVVLGVAVRLLLSRFSKGYIFTVVSLLACVVATVVAIDPPVSGDEGYGLRALFLGLLTACSAITGLISHIKSKKQTS